MHSGDTKTVCQLVRVPNIVVVSQVISIYATFPTPTCVLDRRYFQLQQDTVSRSIILNELPNGKKTREICIA